MSVLTTAVTTETQLECTRTYDTISSHAPLKTDDVIQDDVMGVLSPVATSQIAGADSLLARDGGTESGGEKEKPETEDANQSKTRETDKPVTEDADQSKTRQTEKPQTEDANQSKTRETEKPETEDANQSKTRETEKPQTEDANQSKTRETEKPQTEDANQSKTRKTEADSKERGSKDEYREPHNRESDGEMRALQNQTSGREITAEGEVLLQSSDDIVHSKPGTEQRQTGMEQRQIGMEREPTELVKAREAAGSVVTEKKEEEEEEREKERETQPCAPPTATEHQTTTETTATTHLTIAVETSTIVTETPTVTVETNTSVATETRELGDDVVMAAAAVATYPSLTTLAGEEEEEENLIPFSEQDLSLLYQNRQLDAREQMEEAFIRESYQEHHPLYELLSLYLKALLALTAARAHLQVSVLSLSLVLYQFSRGAANVYWLFWFFLFPPIVGIQLCEIFPCL